LGGPSIQLQNHDIGTVSIDFYRTLENGNVIVFNRTFLGVLFFIFIFQNATSRITTMIISIKSPPRMELLSPSPVAGIVFPLLGEVN
jgi:hypothetical protein